MAGCSSDPTSGGENSALIAAIGTCCAQQSTLMTTTNTKLEAINTSIDECCVETIGKLTEIVDLLTIISLK